METRAHSGVNQGWTALRPAFMAFLCLYPTFLYLMGWRERWKGNVDFPSFQLASRLAFELHQSPYDFTMLKSLAAPLHQPVYPWLYPPVALLFFWPLSGMEYMDAKQVMLLINHLSWLLCLGLSTRILWQEVKAQPQHHWLLMAWILSYFVFTPLSVTLEHGQVNLIVLFGLLLAWTGLREKRAPALTGLGLALAIVLKTYPLLILPWLWWRGERKTVLWTGLSLAMATGFSCLILPLQWWKEWLFQVAPSGGYGRAALGIMDPASPWNQSLNGAFSRLFMANTFGEPWLDLGRLAAALCWVCVVLLCAYTVWAGVMGTGAQNAGISRVDARRVEGSAREPVRAYLAARTSARESLALDGAFALVTTSLFLIAPLSWEHHFVYLIPAFLVILRAFAAGYLTQTGAWQSTFCFLIVSLPFIYDRGAFRQGIGLVASSLPMVAILGLWWAQCQLQRRLTEG